MSNFPWDSEDLNKLLSYFDCTEDITAKAVMDKNRFRKSGRRTPTALDIQHLLLMAVKDKKAVVKRGFLVDEAGYTVRLEPQEKLFSDELFGMISTFAQDVGMFSFLSNKDYLSQNFPEIGVWGKAHDVHWERDYRYWVCMRNALFECQSMGGNIGSAVKLPKYIDGEEFVLRLQWIICQYKALQVFLKHRPLEGLQYYDDEVYSWDSMEHLFVSLLTVHASVLFAWNFVGESGKKISSTTKQKYLNIVRKNIKSGTHTNKGTSESKGYRRVFGDDLFDFKTELSKMRYFSSGTWFREKLEEFKDQEVKEVLAEWADAEDRQLIHQIKKLF